MSEHDTQDILAKVEAQTRWVRALVISAFAIGLWVATIEMRQQQFGSAIDQLQQDARVDQRLLLEVSNDSRWIRENITELRKEIRELKE
jgi:hypothetical protein